MNCNEGIHIGCIENFIEIIVIRASVGECSLAVIMQICVQHKYWTEH